MTEVGTTIGHIVAGFFIVLFASFFFLSDGSRIWAWVVRLFPRAARVRTDASGRVAWRTLTQFVRATVLVAFVDAVGIMMVALVLDVPFASAIGDGALDDLMRGELKVESAPGAGTRVEARIPVGGPS